MKLKPYPKYKDSGIPWVGKIPEGWELYRLKFLLSSLESGSRETGGGSQLDKGVFSLGGEHIKWDGTLNLEKPKLISEEYYNSMNQGKLKINDVLLVKDGATIGKTAILKEMKYQKMAINEHIFLMRPNKRIKPKLLYYLISSDSGFKQIKLTEAGSAQGGINQDFKSDVLFTIPPGIKEQEFLINFLDKKIARIDALIEKDKKLIELLKEKRTALINRTVTKGLDPNVKFKDSGIPWIGKIPEGWEVNRLKFLLSSLESGSRETGGGSQLDEGVFSLGGEHINWDGTLNLENTKLISEEYYNSMNQGKLKINDILLVKDGATIGKTAIFTKKEFDKMAVNEHVFLMRSNKRINPKLLYYLICSDSGFKQIKLTEVGSAQGGINQDFIAKAYFSIPQDKQDQTAIANYLDKATAKIDKTIQKIEKKIALLEEYKKSLIYYVVTGKINIKEVKV